MSDDKDEEVIANPDIHFEPIVHLAPVQTKTLEEDEEEMLKMRAKLFRYDSAGEPREWKERGTGDVKLLRHRQLGTCRLLMRRDKTLKICANHYVLPQLDLKPNCGSDRAWVWSTPADFADEEPKPELLAIRFANSENAQKFQEVFNEAKAIMVTKLAAGKSGRKSDLDANSAKEKASEETGAVKDGDEHTEKGTDRKGEKEQDGETDKQRDGEAEAVAEGMKKLKVGEAAGDSSSGTAGGSSSDGASDSKN